MIVALFPDNHTVVVHPVNHPAGTAPEDQHVVWELPSMEHLRECPMEVPVSDWHIPAPDGAVLTGVLAPPGEREDGAPWGELVVVTRRSAAAHMDMDWWGAMNRAFHLAAWRRAAQYCGTCGAPLQWVPEELARVCPRCDTSVYPRISPAVIMAVVRHGALLMGRAHRHPPGMFSVLAGFVEPGETLEVAVSREVHEECGILVRNVTYFASQPWPFPDSLMIAFTAEHAAGEITVDSRELAEARWCTPAEIPPRIPDRTSVARRLIEWFVGEYGTDDDLRALLAR